jgi:hypothetical protein
MDYRGRIIYVEFVERKRGRGPLHRPLEPIEVITTDGQSLYHYYLSRSVREGWTYSDTEDIESEPVATPITCQGLYHMAYWVAGECASLLDISATYTWGVPGEHPLAGTYTRRRMTRIPPEYLRRNRAGRVQRSGRYGPWNILDDVCEGRTVWCTVCQDYFDESVQQPCSHLRWCDECGDFSTPDERCSHIRGPNRLPDPICTFCQRCGYKQVVIGPSSLFRTKSYGRYRGKCMYCQAQVADWTFLKELQQLPAATPMHLRCPWSHTMYEQEQARWGSGPEFTFAVGDLLVSTGTAGHGQFCYPLANRFRLQARCPVCGNFAAGYEFLNATNRKLLLDVLAYARSQGSGGAQGTGSERRTTAC